eukprot:TRINITY_DN451_c0_g1_i4.p1 TRINITY_DN451_c0_g1~~TRINITY_DN451_c0_g1_i4.p1  ORF type:complete len:123 (-),score=8.69 TRINITY_DN451_c0_g1_i4:43-411(-)
MNRAVYIQSSFGTYLTISANGEVSLSTEKGQAQEWTIIPHLRDKVYIKSRSSKNNYLSSVKNPKPTLVKSTSPKEMWALILENGKITLRSLQSTYLGANSNKEVLLSQSLGGSERWTVVRKD